MAYSQSTVKDGVLKVEDQMRQTHIDGRLTVRVKNAVGVGYDNSGWGVYPMATTPRGLAVIFNTNNIPDYDPREGSMVDLKNLEELCKQLEFTVKTYRDRTKKETLEALDSVIQDPLLKTTDMLMVFMMSHGNKDSIMCSDGEGLKYEEILKKFTCVKLKGKPKFFVFQACRGLDEDVGSDQIMTDSKPVNDKNSIWQDMLIAYSTLPGYVAYRTSNGSWFIQTLVRVFMNNAWNNELTLLLRDVGLEMDNIPSDFKQSFEYTSRNFKKKLYFNPGLRNLENSSNPVNMNMVQTIRPGSKTIEKVNRNQGFTFTDHNLKKDIHTPRLTNTDQADHSLERPGSSFTDHNLKKNVHTPSLTNTDHSLERGSCKVQKIKTGCSVYCLQYDNEKIVAGLNNGSVHIYNKHTSILENNIKAHSDRVFCLQFDKNILLSGSEDKTVKIWQNYTYKLLNTLKLDSFVLCLKCNFNGTLVTSTKEGQLSVWSMKSPTDTKLTKVLHSGGEYFCVDFDNTHIVNGCDENIQVWSTKSLELLKTMTGHKYPVWSLQLENNLVVSLSADKSIRIWKIETGQCIRKLESVHNISIMCVIFDARRIVSASWDGTIEIWDLEAALDTNNASDEVCIRTMMGFTDGVSCLQFDDTQIIFGSLIDKTIRIWNFQTTGIIHGSDVEKRLSKEKNKNKIFFD